MNVLPGTLRLVHGTANPNGAEDAQLYLFTGDPSAAPITEIIPAEGVEVPGRLPDLESNPFRLHILHFNDLHGEVARTTPHGDQAVLSRLVWRARELRRRCQGDSRRGILLFSGGDDLAGGVLGELLRLHPHVHAGYRLYSAAGVDAGAVGNHDLDFGPDLLAHAIEGDARFPLLSANLCAVPSLASLVYPAALLVVKGLRVGLAGLTTRGEVRHAAELGLCQPLIAAQNLLPALRPLCDVLIVLSHLGHSLANNSATTRDAGDVELAAGLPTGSVHLIIGGHTHAILNEEGLSVANLVNGIPIVQAGTMGRFLGEVDIKAGEGVSVTGARLTPTTDLPVDKEFERQHIQPILAEAQPLLARRLGRVADQPDLDTETVRTNFASGESALANLISDALVDACRSAGHPVDLAAIDASSAYRGLPAGGELTFGDWFKVMPYADTVRLHRLTGAQLAALLDDNARRTDRPGEPHVERGFLQFSQQIRYTIELGESRDTARAVQATVGDQPLDQQPDRLFLIACTSFVREAAGPWERRASGELGLPVLNLNAHHVDTDLLVRDLLINHLRSHGGATEDAGLRRDGRLSICRLWVPGRH